MKGSSRFEGHVEQTTVSLFSGWRGEWTDAGDFHNLPSSSNRSLLPA
jgi:hypothetical protein